MKYLEKRKEMWLEWVKSLKEKDTDVLVPNECRVILDNELFNEIKDGGSFKYYTDYINCNTVFIVNKNDN